MIALSLFLPASGPDADQLQIFIDSVFYPVSESTPGELRACLDETGPLDASGQRHDMYTSWNVRWTYLLNLKHQITGGMSC